jgi:hypothetical protein
MWADSPVDLTDNRMSVDSKDGPFFEQVSKELDAT